MSLGFSVSARVARPAAEVFDAIVAPDKLSCYFTTVGGASAPLAEGATVVWWGTQEVRVEKLVAPSHIRLRWQSGAALDGDTVIDIRLQALPDASTLVSIDEHGWRDDDTGRSASYGNCQGWTQMLCSLKCWVEYGINLRAGYYPHELQTTPEPPDEA
ncbi:ATPase [Verticiella sediminum]|uniref:ATPase n=1 Tax=Verticiella sediminum TaxID=1247510 RepID=A0A556AJ00_9BURK|nr:SRPBCC domain-containing protein [Verticiella sediminum]TSH92851.1 ATPase [Verticiella sediminum]